MQVTRDAAKSRRFAKCVRHSNSDPLRRCNGRAAKRDYEIKEEPHRRAIGVAGYDKVPSGPASKTSVFGLGRKMLTSGAPLFGACAITGAANAQSASAPSCRA